MVVFFGDIRGSVREKHLRSKEIVTSRGPLFICICIYTLIYIYIHVYIYIYNI